MSVAAARMYSSKVQDSYYRYEYGTAVSQSSRFQQRAKRPTTIDIGASRPNYRPPPRPLLARMSSLAKARKYNFGRPGGPRKSRRSSTRRAPPRRANSVVANDRPSPRLRPATSRCRCCGCARPAAVAAANLRDLGDRLVLSCCVLNAAVVAAIVLRTSPASVVPPCGRTIRPVSACPNCLLLVLSLRSNSVIVLHVDFGLSNAPPCA